MDLSRISPLTQSKGYCSSTENQSDQTESDNSSGFKYLTVTCGNTLYTYIVIGKNMKILVGKSSVKEKEDTNDERKADADKTADNPAKLALEKQTITHKAELEKANFLLDTRMLGLTAFYQKKLRQIMQNMENNICDKIDDSKTNVSTITKNNSNDKMNQSI